MRSKPADLDLFAAAANKAKDDLRSFREALRCM
jgi:hypothetical protein